MKRMKIGAIDVGTTKVCTIMGDTDGEDLRILGVGVAPSRGLQKGLVVNVGEAKEVISESVKKAEQVAGYRLESAYVGITGRHISSVNSKGAIAITRNDRLVRPHDLRRVLDVARSIRVPSEQRLIHLIPRSYVVDGQEGVKNPVGMHGFRLDVETHVVTAALTSIQNLTKCIRTNNIEVDDLVIEALASAEAVLTEEERQSGVLLADMGGGTTDVTIFKDGTVYYTSVLPVAGHSITRDITLGMGISFELAEEMKKKYGDVTPPAREARGDPDRTLTEDGHAISYRELSDVIRIRVDELFRLIVLELPHTDFAKLIPSGMVVTGGTANLTGIAELGQQVTGLPVRIGYPIDLFGISDTLRDPAYATSVGLLLWKIRNKEAVSWQRPSALRRLVRFFRLFH